MSLKSKFAFQFTLEGMPEKLYFWTFTFVEATTLRDCATAWRRAWSTRNCLYDYYPTIGGVRVFEEHPGKGDISHGWHVHAVFDQRMDISIVKRIVSKYGFGRIDVRKTTPEGAKYLGKYLHKPRPSYAKGTRLWQKLGKCDAHKVSDIKIESRFTDTYHMLCNSIHGFKSMNWTTRRIITTECMLGSDILSALKIGASDQYYESDEDDFWDAIIKKIDDDQD